MPEKNHWYSGCRRRDTLSAITATCHIQMTKEGAEQACAEIEQTETLIQDITGRRPEYLRPPYGAWNEQLECRVNLTTVLWNVDSLDWKLQNIRADCYGEWRKM